MLTNRPTKGRAFLAAAAVAAILSGCGSAGTSSDGGRPPPIRFDGSLAPDSGTTTTPDGGGSDRSVECGRYCNKVFDCGYFPRPDSPPGFTRATCVDQCNTIGGFPSAERRACVESASCACDAGTACHTVDSCFPGIVDGGS
jgi:hypothetical protein